MKTTLSRTLIFFWLLLLPTAGTAQTTKQDSIWQPLKFFVGTWKGKGGGEPGIGDYERSYQYILNKKFIEIHNKSTYPPTGNNLKGEVHQDVGYFSYDKARHIFVLRQFHIEGFVNEYKLDSISADGNTIVFISDAIENISAGWRARETYQLIGPDEFTESFELAPPGKSFEPYTKVTLKRSN